MHTLQQSVRETLQRAKVQHYTPELAAEAHERLQKLLKFWLSQPPAERPKVDTRNKVLMAHSAVAWKMVAEILTEERKALIKREADMAKAEEAVQSALVAEATSLYIGRKEETPCPDCQAIYRSTCPTCAHAIASLVAEMMKSTDEVALAADDPGDALDEIQEQRIAAAYGCDYYGCD